MWSYVGVRLRPGALGRSHDMPARRIPLDRHRSRRPAPARRALLMAVVLLATVGLVQAAAPRALADVTTISQDTLRTGWDQAEPKLSPGTVTSSTFGQLFAAKVQGQVY